MFAAIIMALAFWSGLTRSPFSDHPAADRENSARLTPNSSRDSADAFADATACVEGLLMSARDGDLSAYLAAFGGPLRARLEREADERGRADFASQLRRAGLARTGHAIFAPEPVGDRAGAVRITVESAFADRLECQTFHLERGGTGWLVTEVDAARERVPQNALGSLAKFEEPEGIPVAAGLVEPVGTADEQVPEF
jgi:hypothetical protein